MKSFLLFTLSCTNDEKEVKSYLMSLYILIYSIRVLIYMY